MDKPHCYSYCPYDGERLSAASGLNNGRPLCRKCCFVDYNNPKPCVAIVIVDKDRILLARRAIDPGKGMWDIPGGFVEPSESAEEAVVREALEETSLHVRVTEYLGSLTDEYGPRNIPTLNLCFEVETIGGEPQPHSDVESLSWFSFTQLPQHMAFPHQRQVLEWARSRRSR